MRAHGHALCRHGRPVPDALRGVGQKPLEHGGAEAGPDQPFGDVRIRRVEFVQVRVRLPLFETEFNLPAEPVEPRHHVSRERRAWQIGAEPRHRRVAPRDDHDAEANHTGPAFILDVEVDAAAGVLREEAR